MGFRPEVLDQLVGIEASAHDAGRCLVEQTAVVGHVDRNRRLSRRHDTEQVALVDEVLRHLLEDRARAQRQTLFDVQIVDEDDDQPPPRFTGRAGRRRGREDHSSRQSRRRGDLAARAPPDDGHQGNDGPRPIVLDHEEVLRGQVGQKTPFRSRGTTTVVISVMPERNIASGAGSAGRTAGRGSCRCPCAPRTAPSTTTSDIAAAGIVLKGLPFAIASTWGSSPHDSFRGLLGVPLRIAARVGAEPPGRPDGMLQPMSLPHGAPDAPLSLPVAAPQGRRRDRAL